MPEKSPPMADQIEKAYTRIGVTGSHYFVMGMILLGVFFDAIEQNAVGIAGPVLADDWGLDKADLALLNTMTFSATALGRVATGLIADRFGRRSLLVVNLLIFAFGSLACALAPNYAFLCAARFAVGFGLGGEIAVAVVMTSEYFAARQRGTAVALINVTAAGFGNMLAPAFGLAVFAVFDAHDKWRWIFGLLFLPAILVLWFRRYVPETPRYLASKGRIREANVVLTKFAHSDLKAEVSEPTEYLVAADRGPQEDAPRGSFLDIFRGVYLRRTLLLTIAVSCSYAAQFCMLTLMPAILKDSGYNISKSLWYTLLMQSGSLVGACIAAFFAARWPRKKTLTFAPMLGCAAGLALAFLHGSIVLIVVWGWLLNCAIIIQNSTIWLFAPENYPTRIRGFGTSFILAAGSLSGGLFPILGAKIFDAHGFAAMFGVMSCLFVAVFLAIRFMAETFGKPLEEETDVR